jgi:hypothetical protein
MSASSALTYYGNTCYNTKFNVRELCIDYKLIISFAFVTFSAFFFSVLMGLYDLSRNGWGEEFEDGPFGVRGSWYNPEFEKEFES